MEVNNAVETYLMHCHVGHARILDYRGRRIPGLEAPILDARAFLGLVQDEHNLLLAELRAFHPLLSGRQRHPIREIFPSR